MSANTDVDLPADRALARTADFISQATAVEQARAVAEVQAAIVVAQQCPRSIQRAVEEMRDSCRQKALAERAFFSYRRAGSNVTGPSVHFARELARAFGNVQYGITELRRDDVKGESEMAAFAWDVERNTRTSNTFIVPHARDTKEGRKPIVDLRDVYENNANMGARRLREAILSILPAWFIEEAKDLCTTTLRDGGGKSLAQRRADAIKSFERLSVNGDRLASRLGRPADKWTEIDVANLGVLFRSIERGETTLEEQFPQDRVTADEITAPPAAPQNRARNEKPASSTAAADEDQCPVCGAKTGQPHDDDVHQAAGI